MLTDQNTPDIVIPDEALRVADGLIIARRHGDKEKVIGSEHIFANTSDPMLTRPGGPLDRNYVQLTAESAQAHTKAAGVFYDAFQPEVVLGVSSDFLRAIQTRDAVLKGMPVESHRMQDSRLGFGQSNRNHDHPYLKERTGPFEPALLAAYIAGQAQVFSEVPEHPMVPPYGETIGNVLSAVVESVDTAYAARNGKRFSIAGVSHGGGVIEAFEGVAADYIIMPERFGEAGSIDTDKFLGPFTTAPVKWTQATISGDSNNPTLEFYFRRNGKLEQKGLKRSDLVTTAKKAYALAYGK